ncbi:MAG: ATP-binding protein [Opitutaceae bacterium]
MASQQAIELLKALITSHGRGDETSFEKATESIIRQLAIENKPGEAKYLRDAATAVKHNGANGKSLAAFPKSSPSAGLISFTQGVSEEALFFDPETQVALERVLAEQRAVAKLAEAGLRPKTKLLFWGPPGCGKTAAARWLAAQLGIPVGTVRLGALITSYVGETGSNIQKIFSAADQSPMVLLLDEADAVAKSRDDENDVGELRRVVNALLQGLDQFTSRRSIVILATNHSFLFDSALWRRFDDVVAFPLPKEAQRAAVLKHLASGLKVKGNLTGVARKLTGRSFEEITRSVVEVAKSSLINGTADIEAAQILAAAAQWRGKMSSALKKPKRKK